MRFFVGCLLLLFATGVPVEGAEWFVDKSQGSPIEAVSLRVQAEDGERVFRPIKVALDRLHDPDKGFYGHAVDMARQL